MPFGYHCVLSFCFPSTEMYSGNSLYPQTREGGLIHSPRASFGCQYLSLLFIALYATMRRLAQFKGCPHQEILILNLLRFSRNSRQKCWGRKKLFLAFLLQKCSVFIFLVFYTCTQLREGKKDLIWESFAKFVINFVRQKML